MLSSHNEFLSEREFKIMETLNLYVSLDEDTLKQYEDKIFTDKISNKKRAIIEFNRVFENLRNDSRKMARNLKDLKDIEKLIKMLELDETIVTDIYKLIVKIQIDCDMDIRLFSVVTDMYKEYQVLILEREDLAYRSKVGR